MEDTAIKLTWSGTSAFDDYIESLEYMDEDIDGWMDSYGITDIEYARRVFIDNEWEHWDLSSDLTGWTMELAFEYDVDYDYLNTRANILLTEDINRTLVFDAESKTLN